MIRQCTAALFEGPGHGFSLNTMELSPLDTGEVLVEVTACAVCGSDLHTIAGRRPCPQHTILGHEIRTTENALQFVKLLSLRII